MLHASEAIFLSKKKILELQRPQNSSGDCVGFWEVRIWLRQGRGCGYGVTMLTMEAVGNGGKEKVEGFGGDGKGEINGRHQYDHR